MITLLMYDVMENNEFYYAPFMFELQNKTLLEFGNEEAAHGSIPVYSGHMNNPQIGDRLDMFSGETLTRRYVVIGTTQNVKITS